MNSEANIEIDEILLAYEFDKLALENISNDIFDEISKDDEHLNIENVLLPSEEDKKDKSCSENCSKHYKNFTQEALGDNKSCSAQQKQEVSPKKSDGNKDINGNEEPVSDENLNHLLDELTLSDSDNEDENKKSLKLRERAPIRSRKRPSRNREQNLSVRNENVDRAHINPERLLFLSGSNRVDLNDITVTYPSVYQDNLTLKISGNETFVPTYDSNLFYEDGASNCINESVLSQNDAVVAACSSNDSAYDDCGVNFLSSPESGYETSQSLTGSPPLFPFNVSESILPIPEIVDEEQILESLVDYENPRAGALPVYNPFALGLDENDHKGIILDYLKDLQPELNLYTEHVPFLNDISLNSASDVTPTLVNSETPIACRPLNDKAKSSLREILSVDKFLAAQAKIYKRIREKEKKDDLKNKKEIKVISIEDEMDKTSENQTNLHQAVINGWLEDIYCLVEIHKQYNNKSFSVLNLRDKNGKTAFDYAVQKDMQLVIEYLKENNACPGLNM